MRIFIVHDEKLTLLKCFGLSFFIEAYQVHSSLHIDPAIFSEGILYQIA